MKKTITVALKLCIGVGLFSAMPSEVAAGDVQEQFTLPSVVSGPIKAGYPFGLPPQPQPANSAKTVKDGR